MLSELKFTDIYLGEKASWLAGIPGTLDPIPAPDDVREELLELRHECDKVSTESKRDEFAVRYKSVAYRASTMHTMSEHVFVLRRFPEVVPQIDALNLHPYVIERLLEQKISGLIVVSGPFGQGKTTTASAILKERLKIYGGVAVTIEDPPEMPLEGRHGEGVCYQTWVDQGGFGQACRQAARWAPSMIFVGEVRDSETASEAMRASINGRLVICTTHADNVVGTISRLFSLANGSAGNSEDVAALLSHGLTAVVHQRLEGDMEKRPKLEFLFLRGDDAHGARSLIRSRKFDQLGSEINLQLNKMLSGGGTRGALS